MKNELLHLKDKIVVVSKNRSVEEIMELYNQGFKIFGENRVQELLLKVEETPKDIQWHLIGHLQSNKVKYIAPFVALIHSVDSISLLREIDKQGARNNRVIHCLLQIHIAQEETKYGLSTDQTYEFLSSPIFSSLQHVSIDGLMGMASFTEDMDQVRAEFKGLSQLFTEVKTRYFADKPNFNILSMGMSGDYTVAIEEGSNLIRVGSLIFGERNY